MVHLHSQVQSGPLKNGGPDRLAPVLAVIMGVLLGVAEQQLGHLPVYQAAAGGLLLGLAASGVYDASKLIGAGDEGGPPVVAYDPQHD